MHRDWKWLLIILYGLLVIWTGLVRCIETQSYKPNALWFCLVTGLIAIAAGFLYRLNKLVLAAFVALAAIVPVLSYYMLVFVIQPEKDATMRIGLVLLASIAALIVVFLPKGQEVTDSKN